MKITNLENVSDLFKVVEKCKGSVYLVTNDGDKLNLKSKLCQYIALTNAFKNAKINEAEIFVSDPEDAALLFAFILTGRC